MPRKQTIDRLLNSTTPKQERRFDAVEEVVVYYDELAHDWHWKYSLYEVTESGGRNHVLTRLGALNRQNPSIHPRHLHRQLIDPETGPGTFIPPVEDWERAGAGKDAGWAFSQRQKLERARQAVG